MTETVLLAGLGLADVKPLRRMLARGQIDFPYFYDLAPSQAAFRYVAGALVQNHRHLGPVMNGIYTEDEHVLMGAVVLLPEFRNKRRAEIGYFLHNMHQGRGIASAAVRFVVQEAMGVWLSELEATVHPDNFRSRRVLEGLGLGLMWKEPSSKYLEADGRGYAPRYHYWAGKEQIEVALGDAPQRSRGPRSLPRVERIDAALG